MTIDVLYRDITGTTVVSSNFAHVKQIWITNKSVGIIHNVSTANDREGEDTVAKRKRRMTSSGMCRRQEAMEEVSLLVASLGRGPPRVTSSRG